MGDISLHWKHMLCTCGIAREAMNVSSDEGNGAIHLCMGNSASATGFELVLCFHRHLVLLHGFSRDVRGSVLAGYKIGNGFSAVCRKITPLDGK